MMSSERLISLYLRRSDNGEAKAHTRGFNQFDLPMDGIGSSLIGTIFWYISR